MAAPGLAHPPLSSPEVPPPRRRHRPAASSHRRPAPTLEAPTAFSPPPLSSLARRTSAPDPQPARRDPRSPARRAHAPAVVPTSATSLPGALAALARFLATPSPRGLPPSAAVLSGAGLSVASGLADYRGANGTYRVNGTYRPIFYADFLASHEARQRYWARSFIGWPGLDRASPNAAHHALARLGDLVLVRAVVTQNVDSLHPAAHPRLPLRRAARLPEVHRLHLVPPRLLQPPLPTPPGPPQPQLGQAAAARPRVGRPRHRGPRPAPLQGPQVQPRRRRRPARGPLHHLQVSPLPPVLGRPAPEARRPSARRPRRRRRRLGPVQHRRHLQARRHVWRDHRRPGQGGRRRGH